jgi:hypothetical protein
MISEKYTRIITEDSVGDLVIDLGNEICEQLGWRAGDVLEWTENSETGEWLLTKSTTQP